MLGILIPGCNKPSFHSRPAKRSTFPAGNAGVAVAQDDSFTWRQPIRLLAWPSQNSCCNAPPECQRDSRSWATLLTGFAQCKRKEIAQSIQAGHPPAEHLIVAFWPLRACRLAEGGMNESMSGCRRGALLTRRTRATNVSKQYEVLQTSSNSIRALFLADVRRRSRPPSRCWPSRCTRSFSRRATIHHPQTRQMQLLQQAAALNRVGHNLPPSPSLCLTDLDSPPAFGRQWCQSACHFTSQDRHGHYQDSAPHCENADDK